MTGNDDLRDWNDDLRAEVQDIEGWNRPRGLGKSYVRINISQSVCSNKSKACSGQQNFADLRPNV